MNKSQKVTPIIAAIITQANSVAAQHEQYVGEFVTRARPELYKILAEIYGVLLTVNASPHSSKILSQMRDDIKAKAFKNGKKANVPKKSATSIVIRYITNAESKTVSVYKRVFDTAIAKDIDAEGLAAFITATGGIDKCGKALANAEDKRAAKIEKAKQIKAASTQMMGITGLGTVQYSTKTNLPLASDVEFVHVLCRLNHETKAMDIVGTIYPNVAIEREALSTQLLCVQAASLDMQCKRDKTKFHDYCNDAGLDVDQLRNWMACNGLDNEVAVKEHVTQLRALVENHNGTIKALCDSAEMLKLKKAA
jgi:hypothetical protein